MLQDFDVLFFSLAIAAITTTITKGAIFKTFRARLPGPFLKSLFNCPYCLSHYVAVPFAYLLTQTVYGLVVYTFAFVAISSLFTFPLILYIRWLDNV